MKAIILEGWEEQLQEVGRQPARRASSQRDDRFI